MDKNFPKLKKNSDFKNNKIAIYQNPWGVTEARLRYRFTPGRGKKQEG